MKTDAILGIAAVIIVGVLCAIAMTRQRPPNDQLAIPCQAARDRASTLRDNATLLESPASRGIATELAIWAKLCRQPEAARLLQSVSIKSTSTELADALDTFTRRNTSNP